MKKLFVFVFTIVLSFSMMGIGNAALIDNGGNLIYDTDLNITWYDPVPTSMSWNQAMNWAGSLNVGGVTGWRLPTTPGAPGGEFYYPIPPANYGEMGHLNYVELGNVLRTRRYYT
jgi:hypothetical protein